jgi:hypothetical protein
MSLYETLDSTFKESLKAKDSLKVSVLRMVRTALKNKEVELIRKLEDDEILRVLSSQIKQRKDAIEQFRQGGRSDLADKEEQELAILESFMPKALDAEELKSGIQAVIAETGASSMKDMGKVMKEAMRRFAGRADGKEVSEMVKKQLSG